MKTERERERARARETPREKERERDRERKKKPIERVQGTRKFKVMEVWTDREIQRWRDR